MNTRLISVLLMMGLIGTLVGCARPHYNRHDEPSKINPRKTEKSESHLIRASYDAVDRVLKAIESSHLNFNLSKTRPLIATSFVDIDDVRYSSTFGRMIGEQVGSRFSQSNYKVIELKMRHDIFMPSPIDGVSSGEFMLSRELRNLSFEHDAQAVVVGTYAAAKNIVYVTLKVVDARSNIILYSTDYSLPVDDNIKRMLRDQRRRRR